MKFFIFLLLFFIVGGLLIISNSNLALINPNNLFEFTHLYVGWLGNVFQNFKTLTGYVTDLKWF